MIVQRSVGVHVMLQNVFPVPAVRTESNRIERQIRPELVLWLVNPVVPKRSKDRGSNSLQWWGGRVQGRFVGDEQ